MLVALLMYWETLHQYFLYIHAVIPKYKYLAALQIQHVGAQRLQAPFFGLWIGNKI